MPGQHFANSACVFRLSQKNQARRIGKMLTENLGLLKFLTQIFVPILLFLQFCYFISVKILSYAEFLDERITLFYKLECNKIWYLTR